MALFDGLGDLTGHIYADKIIKDMKGATQARAYQYITDAYASVNKGIGGFTKNDAKQLAKLVEYYGSAYGVNVKQTVTNLNSYDPKGKNANNQVSTLNTLISGLNPKSQSTTKTSSSGGGSGAYGSGSGGGGFRGTTETNNNTTYPSSGGGGGYAPINTVSSPASSNEMDPELKARLDELYELTRPRSAKENAERYGIDYDEQHILDDYNTKTNEYYQTALDELAKTRHDYKTNSIRQYDRTIDDAMLEYSNAAPTATQRGSLAANALAEYMYSNSAINEYDYNMLQADNNLREAWKAELANNANEARQYYNSIGKYLSSLGVQQNQADVKQYIDYLDAYGQMYTARRNTDSYIAQGTANKYAGLANAAVNRANAQANSSNLEMLYNYYLATNGGNSKRASTQLVNDFQRSQGYNQKSGGGN